MKTLARLLITFYFKQVECDKISTENLTVYGSTLRLWDLSHVLVYLKLFTLKDVTFCGHPGSCIVVSQRVSSTHFAFPYPFPFFLSTWWRLFFMSHYVISSSFICPCVSMVFWLCSWCVDFKAKLASDWDWHNAIFIIIHHVSF